jgi:hypothetical protein
VPGARCFVVSCEGGPLPMFGLRAYNDRDGCFGSSSESENGHLVSLIIIPGKEHEHESATWWQFRGLVDSGAFSGSNNAPVIVTAESPARERDEWVLKPLARLGEIGSIRELIGYRFAQAMGIPVIESGVVEISEQAIAPSPILREMFSSSVGPNFASRYVPGVVDLIHADEVIRQHRGTATNIYAWDVLVDNIDRRLQRSNLVVSNDQLLAIDHELTFSWFGVIGGPGPVWAVSILHRLAKEHFLANHVTRWNLGLDEFKQRLVVLSSAEMAAITENIPARWMQAEGSDFLAKVRQYLDDVQTRADSIVNLIDGGRSR